MIIFIISAFFFKWKESQKPIDIKTEKKEELIRMRQRDFDRIESRRLTQVEKDSLIIRVNKYYDSKIDSL